MNYHLRFTPYDISGYSFDWLNRYNKYIVCQEDKDDLGNTLLHYHILINTDNATNTVRDMAKTKMKIPAGNGRGKNNKYFSLITDWKDPGYICKYGDFKCSKGYTEKELMDFVISGKQKYLDKTEKIPAENSVTAGSKSTTPKCPRIPYQQQIISIAYAEWINHKKRLLENGQSNADAYDLVPIVCKAMREQSRGINAYLLQDICNAVLFDDPDFQERTLQRLKSKIQL